MRTPGGNFLDRGDRLVGARHQRGQRPRGDRRAEKCTVVAGIEEDGADAGGCFDPLMRLLTRSATGQEISNYVSVKTAPAQRRGDSDGP